MPVTVHFRMVFIDAKIGRNIILIGQKSSCYQQVIKDLAIKQ